MKTPFGSFFRINFRWERKPVLCKWGLVQSYFYLNLNLHGSYSFASRWQTVIASGSEAIQMLSNLFRKTAMVADFLYQKEKFHILQQSFSGKVFYAADKVRIFLLLDSELLSHIPCVLQNHIQGISYPNLT